MDQPDVRIKRVYSDPNENDGRRILVDRLWPRGLTKERAKVDLWLKDAAPSKELRTWFGHDPGKWSEFKRRYAEELSATKEPIEALMREARHGRITLLYGARDEDHNEAVVLLHLLRKHA